MDDSRCDLLNSTPYEPQVDMYPDDIAKRQASANLLATNKPESAITTDVIDGV